jgi:hypothetical protein
MVEIAAFIRAISVPLAGIVSSNSRSGQKAPRGEFSQLKAVWHLVHQETPRIYRR